MDNLLFVSDVRGGKQGIYLVINRIESKTTSKRQSVPSNTNSKIPTISTNPIMLVGFLSNAPQADVTVKQHTDEEWEAQIAQNKSDPSIWIKWAISRLPEERFSKGSNESISILGRALQSFRDDPCVWAFYLELFSRRGNPRDVRAIFGQAVSGHSFVRSNQFIWWRWYLWEEKLADKLAVLTQFLQFVMEEREAAFDSVLFVELIFEIAYVYCRMGVKAKGVNFLHKILCAKMGNIKQVVTELGETWEPSGFALADITDSWAYKVLPTRLLYFTWLYYIHQVFHEGKDLLSHTREQLFYAYPYNFKLVDPVGALFEINWSVKSPRDLESDSLKDVRYLIEYLHDGAKRGASGADQVLYLAVLRNCGAFHYWEGMQESMTRADDLYNDCLSVGGVIESELFDAVIRFQLSQVCGQIVFIKKAWRNADVESVDAILDIFNKRFRHCPFSFGLWNSYVKICWRLGREEDGIVGLVNCARVCFVGLDIV